MSAYSTGRKIGRFSRRRFDQVFSTTNGSIFGLVALFVGIAIATDRPIAGWIGAGLGLFLTVGLSLLEMLEEALFEVSLWTKVQLGAAAGALAGSAFFDLRATAAVGAVLLVWLARAGRRRWRRWRWWRWYRSTYETYIEPLHDRLTGPGGPLPELADADPLAYIIDLHPNLLDEPGGFVITWPRGPIPTAPRVNEVIRQVVTTCGLSDYRVERRFEGTQRWLRFLPKTEGLPDEVPWDDLVTEALESAPPHKKFCGITTGGKPFYIDQKAENPHTMIVATTGWGKTTAVGIMAADELHKGGEVLMLDPKFGSMRWLFGLPGVTYARMPGVQHDKLVLLGRELLRRRDILGNTDYTEQPEFPRLFVIIEESAALLEDLQDHWIELRAEMKAEAKELEVPFTASPRSPAIKAYRQTLRMGRELGVFVVVIDRRGEARDVGGSGPRTDIGNVIMGWPSKATWKMHAPQHPYVPHDGTKGRCHLARGNDLSEIQFVNSKVEDLRAWATSGKEPSTVLSQGSSTSSALGIGGGRVLGQRRLQVVPETDGEPEPKLITLRDAACDTGPDGGLVPVALSTLQRYARPSRRESVGFPEAKGTDGNAQVFDVEEVLEWSRNRPAEARRKRGLDREVEEVGS